MKNGKKAISLALTALTVVSLSSCFDVSQKDKGEILTYDYNGTALQLTTQDIINKYLNEDRTEHAKAFYDALYEVVVRVSFEDKGLLSKYKSAVESSARDDVLNAKNEADDNGKSWHDYLVDAGYNDDNTTDEQKENELYLDKLYSRMTDRVNTEFSNKFNKWEMADDPEQKQYNALWGKEGYLTNRLPYHVRHILVKVDASETNGQYSRGHISSANVDKLYKTITRLVEGDSFSSVAKNFTDDESSASTGGEYVMDIETSFVNEFQLGLYTYDAILNEEQYKDEKDFAEKTEKLHIPESVKTNLTDFGVTYIPYGVVEEMYAKKDIEKTANGLVVNEGDADYFPRNIYFNKYFQNRNVAFITDEDNFETKDLNIDSNNAGYHTIDDKISGQEVYTDINDGKYLTKEGSKFTTEESKLRNFKPLTINGVTKNVLHDTDGNPILVVRNQESSGGIHFIIVERSAFDESDVHFNRAEYIAQGATEANVDKYKTKLNEYYATTNPKDREGFDPNTQKPYYVSSFPHVEETCNGAKAFIPKKTYVQTAIVTATNDVYSRVNDYDQRINKFKESLNSMESVTQFSKYEWLNTTAKVEFSKDLFGTDINGLIQKYISTQKETISRNSEKTIQDRWYQYSTAIKKQSNERQYNLLPEILAADFGNPVLYQKDGPGYNSKYDSIKPGYETENPEGNN